MGALSLREAYKQKMVGLDLDRQEDIPTLVWLLENPASPVSLPGKIGLFGHDRLHILLDLGISPAEEAFVVGFSMGTDLRSSWLDVQVFKLASKYLYPTKFRFSDRDLLIFDRGFQYGRNRPVKYLNLANFRYWLDSGIDVSVLRNVLAIDPQAVKETLRTA